MKNATTNSISYEIVPLGNHSLDGTDPDQPQHNHGREARP